ncbi:hypothetical protein [Kineococcus sp. SYSU DK004]|uniref:hypothetical protein n=1 Tax=Kineococcus sp. SYSU DK004 TaxID=3383125 RepID=UPI003D7D2BE4
MRLHVVYGTGASPDGRSLATFCTALDAARGAGLVGDAVFLTDGPLPLDRVRAVDARGVVRPAVPSRGRRAAAAVLDVPGRGGWDEEDVVLLADDGWDWRREALVAVAVAAQHHPGAYLLPGGGQRSPGQERVRWVERPGAPGAFAARVRELRRDRRSLLPLRSGERARARGVASALRPPRRRRRVLTAVPALAVPAGSAVQDRAGFPVAEG